VLPMGILLETLSEVWWENSWGWWLGSPLGQELDNLWERASETLTGYSLGSLSGILSERE